MGVCGKKEKKKKEKKKKKSRKKLENYLKKLKKRGDRVARKKKKKSRKKTKKKKKTGNLSKKLKNLQKINFITSKDSEGNTIIKVSDSWSNQAYVNDSKYKKKYKLSIKENEKFWAKEGKRISWIKKYTKIKDIKYSKEDVKIKWYYDGTLNASANCIDRHLKKKSKKNSYNLGWR